MDAQRERFEQLLEMLIQFVDNVNESHVGGVYFGTEHPLYPAEIHTVVAIGANEGIGLTQLAEKLGISKATLSERVRKLVAKGFVKKKKNPDDRKAVLLVLTADGKKAERHHEKLHATMFDMFCNYFGDDAESKIELFEAAFRELTQFQKDMPGHC